MQIQIVNICLIWNKQHITLDNSCMLLYTVYQQEGNDEYYYQSYIYGTYLLTDCQADPREDHRRFAERERTASIRPDAVKRA